MINKNVSYPRFSESKDKNHTRCPVYDCFKKFNSPMQLQNHITRIHKELHEYGIEVDASGKINIPENI